MLTSAASVPKLIDAVLALNVHVGPEGVSSAVDRVDNRQEFVRPVPSTFPVVLGVVFESEADVPVAIEVRHMGKAV